MRCDKSAKNGSKVKTGIAVFYLFYFWPIFVQSVGNQHWKNFSSPFCLHKSAKKWVIGKNKTRFCFIFNYNPFFFVAS